MRQKKNVTYSRKAALELIHRRSGIRVPKDKLKIFVVGANRDQDETGFLQALRKLGTVRCFYNDMGEYGPIYSTKRLDDEVRQRNSVALIEQFNAFQKDGFVDLVIGQMWADFLPVEALSHIRANGTFVINIAMDDRAVPAQWETVRGTLTGAIGLSSETDLVLNTSPECCLRYLVHDCPSIYWPLASDPELFNANIAKDIDVLFIGSKYGIREKVVRAIEQRFR